MASAAHTTKSAGALRTISEVADILELPQHVLRFWETKFPQIQPLKRRGGRRFYRPEDIAVLETVRTLLHEKGYTIKGAQSLLAKSGGKPKLVKDALAAAHPPVTGESLAPARGRVTDAGAGAKLTAVRQELLEMRELLRKAG